MIILKEYSVSADNKWLTIDVIVTPSLQEQGVYLSALRVSCIGSEGGVGDFDPSDTSAATFDTLIAEAINEYDPDGGVIDWESNPTQIRIKLDVDTLIKPFYLYVKAEDPNEVVTTCAHKNTLNAVTFNKYPLYQAIACLAKEFNGCEPPMHFIDYLLKLKALEASIATNDPRSINYYFDWLILHGKTGHTKCNDKSSAQPINKGCGCNH